MRSKERGIDFLIPHSSFLSVSHGQGEIRTHDTGLPYTGFRDRRLQPLGHLSKTTKYRWAPRESQREAIAAFGVRIASRINPHSAVRGHALCLSKNSRSTCAHSSASTPPTTSGR